MKQSGENRTSMERLAMLEDVHCCGNGAIARLAAEHDVCGRAVYGWLEHGFPDNWGQAKHERFRALFLRITGGGHLLGHWRSEAESGGDIMPGDVAAAQTMRREAVDCVDGAADVVRRVVDGLDDGRLTDGERIDVSKALSALEGHIARLRAKIGRV